MHNYTQKSSSKSTQKTAAIVGARGYAGLELARLILHHSKVQLTHCFATSDFSLSKYISHPLAQAVRCLPESEIEKHFTDFIFLATPADVSMQLTAPLLQQGRTVIDLSGAFRLIKNDYQKWYGFQHQQNDLLKISTYGLAPWVGPYTQSQKLIANPGCYATAVSLALIPLLKKELIDENSIVIDAKSGTSGAGKKLSENMLFTEVAEECLPYKVGEHQHLPEIQEAVEQFSGKKINPHFTTSLLPIRRGIIAGIYANLTAQAEEKDIHAALCDAYADNVLFEIANIADQPQWLSLKKVVGTAKTHISFKVVDKKVYIFSTIDNLLKGAASQAIENLNRILDLPSHESLSYLEARL